MSLNYQVSCYLESNKNINVSMSYLPENVVVKLRFSSSINFEDQFDLVSLI